MIDDIARQLVAYVDATTTPTTHPKNTSDAEVIMLQTRTDANRADDDTPARRRTRRSLTVAAGLLALGLLGGLLAVGRSANDDGVSTTSVEFDLVGGEDVNDLSHQMGYGFAGDPLIEINSPGPTLEVVKGDEVTVTFTNRHGWSQNPEDTFFESVDQSFRIVTPGQIGDVKFGADTGLVAPGETVSITFTPDEAGEYRYVSTGLISTGMFGRFIVVDDDAGGS